MQNSILLLKRALSIWALKIHSYLTDVATFIPQHTLYKYSTVHGIDFSYAYILDINEL